MNAAALTLFISDCSSSHRLGKVRGAVSTYWPKFQRPRCSSVPSPTPFTFYVFFFLQSHPHWHLWDRWVWLMLFLLQLPALHVEVRHKSLTNLHQPSHARVLAFDWAVYLCTVVGPTPGPTLPPRKKKSMLCFRENALSHETSRDYTFFVLSFFVNRSWKHDNRGHSCLRFLKKRSCFENIYDRQQCRCSLRHNESG